MRMRLQPSLASSRQRRGGFTIPEVLVVGGIIAVLIALILPALRGGMSTAELAKSKSSMKQIFTWMTSYSSENRDYIVPSQFDYTAAAAISPVKVRSFPTPSVGAQYQGTWTDILWVYGGMNVQGLAADNQYVYDSPDAAYYATYADDDSNPFRSARNNSKDAPNPPANGIPTPFGTGAAEGGQPGYFAANNFFNSTPAAGDKWYVRGQIKVPERSMYLVDSLAGETIEPDETAAGPWDNPALDPTTPTPALNLQVDFRYNNACLMMFLDGHSDAYAPWRDLAELESVHRIKVRNLTQN